MADGQMHTPVGLNSCKTLRKTAAMIVILSNLYYLDTYNILRHSFIHNR